MTIRADHVGSLLRPPALLEARRRFAAGEIDEAALAQAEDAAILEALAMQAESGIGVATDGEYRRAHWYDGFRMAADGFEPYQRTMPAMWRGTNAEAAADDMKRTASYAVGGKLSLRHRFTAREAGFLAKHAKGPFKITVPSPASYQMLFEPGFTDRAYPDAEAMLADIVELYKGELAALSQETRYIQLDSLRYGDVIDADRRARWVARGIDPMAIVDQTLAADNAVLAAAARPGVTRAMHICRGNHRSAWVGEGGYEPVAERMLGQLDVDRFLLEYDDARSGGFEPLRFVPKGKVVVLGLVTTKTGELEDQDELRRRIDQAAQHVPMENLALGTQCGFASTELGNLLTWDDMRRKLALIADTARKVWG